MMIEQQKLEKFGEDRDTVKIKHIAEVNPKKSEVSGESGNMDVSFVPLDALGTRGEIKYTETKLLEDVYDGYTYFREGDILLAKITPSFENGKGAICENLSNKIGFGTTEIHVLRPHEQIDTEFLWYILRSKPFVEEAKAAMRGVAGQKRIPSSFIEHYEIPHISYESQQNKSSFVSSRISKIDKTIDIAEEIKDTLEKKRLSVIWEQITCSSESRQGEETGISWLGEIPEDWDVAKIGWYYDIQLGKMLDESEITGESLAPYLRNQDIHWWEVNTDDLPKMDFSEQERELYQLEYGDVLVCEGGFGCGESAVWRHDSKNIYYQKALHRVRAKDEQQVPEFFCYFMEFAVKNGIFSADSNQSTIDHITVEKLSNQKMPIPPKQEQREIVHHLTNVSNKVDNATSDLDNLISKLGELRESTITSSTTD